ncbi:hypothetical protein K502DRAFT_338913 [Neoconidiobolus thromboides FSU 785]|nr:hypothetical protein K502DRAFT_338913 [Neoconidiobolus thromboides FSU 785]
MKEKYIETPLDVIDEILDQYDINSWEEAHERVSKEFEAFLAKDNVIQELFLLQSNNLEALPNYHNKLVRFHGMIQDNSYGQEMIISQYIENDKICYNSYRNINEVDVKEEIRMENYKLEDVHITQAISTPGIYNSTERHLNVLLKFYGKEKSTAVGQLTEVVGVSSSIDNQVCIHVVFFSNINEPMKLYQDLEVENTCFDARSINKEIIEHFKGYFNNDKYASELLCLFLLNCNVNIEEFHSLNLVFTQKHDISKLIQFIKSVLPIVNVFDLTINSLNQTQLFPSNMSGDNLEWAKLQLPKKSLLIINEMDLEEGQLNDNGINNLNWLMMLTSDNKLTYRFSHFNQVMAADYRVLILSKHSSLLGSSFKINLDDKDIGNSINNIDNEVVNLFKYYFNNKIEGKNFELNDEVSKVIQEDYVNLRKEGKLSYQNLNNKAKEKIIFGPEDLNNLLCLMKLVTISNGYIEEDSVQNWKHCLDLYLHMIHSFSTQNSITSIGR